MNREAKTESEPTNIDATPMIFTMNVMMIILVVAKLFMLVVVFPINCKIMLMEMKHPNHKKHKQQTNQANARSPFDTSKFVKCMGEQMQKCNA